MPIGARFRYNLPEKRNSGHYRQNIWKYVTLCCLFTICYSLLFPTHLFFYCEITAGELVLVSTVQKVRWWGALLCVNHLAELYSFPLVLVHAVHLLQCWQIQSFSDWTKERDQVPACILLFLFFSCFFRLSGWSLTEVLNVVMRYFVGNAGSNNSSW